MKEFTEENFTITQDDLERILLGCTTCHVQIILEDVMQYRMEYSKLFGRFRAAAYTVRNMAKMDAFVRAHQHDKE